MPYTTRDATRTLFGYLGLNETEVEFIPETSNRAFIYNLPNGDNCVIFIYAISRKVDNTKNFFDTRDSGARERGVAWNYALSHDLKYFCIAVHDQVEKYTDYAFSLECNEHRIAEVAGTIGGRRNSSGTQVVIPNDFEPDKPFERIKTRFGFYIAVAHKTYLQEYLQTYDNRPYMVQDEPVELDEVETVPPQEQKERFRIWMTNQRKANGEPYSTNTITSYISQMSRGYDSFDKYHGYESVFEIQSAEELNEYTEYLFNAPGFDEFNDAAGNKACSNGFVKYGQFLAEQNSVTLELRFDTPLASTKPRNRIIFGAPGTGKSFMLNRDRKALLGDDNETDYERVTFHPDYSYANFVGTYKPVPSVDSDGKDVITYEYVPGPFMRVYVNALKNGRTEDVRPFLLIIEEINRANVAAVFGDIFQLLDRDETGVSEYPIQASEDMKKYLAKELGGEPDDYGKIRLPNNMFIWATMNSADQGVFPMDTAFKRRWDFTYIGIDDNDADIRGKTVVLGTARRQRVEWNKLRKAINRFLAKQKINEDKQLGPYFISRSIVVPENGNEIDSAAFIDTFKNKVLMYLFEDAAKQKRSTLFEGCFEGKGRYSEICREFEEKGIGIFYHEIALDTEPEDLAAANGDITETGDEQV